MSYFQERLPGAEFEESIPKSVALMLINIIDGVPHFLASKRLNRNGYTIPGGKQEPKEKPKQATLRELFEETGILFDSDNFFPPQKFLISAHPDKKNITICDNGSSWKTRIYFTFYDEATSQQPINTEPNKQEAWQWIPLSQLFNLVMVGNLHPVLIQEFMLSQISESISIQESQQFVNPRYT